MAEEQKGIHCTKILAPLPNCERGYGYAMHYTTKKKGEYVYTSSKSVILRSFEDHTECSNFDGHTVNPTVANVSPNGEWVASGDVNGKLKIWGRNNKNVRYDYDVLSATVTDIAWDADGKRLAAVGRSSQNPYAKIISWDTGTALGGIEGAAQTKNILSCDYRKQRPYKVVVCGEDNSVSLHSGPPFKGEWSRCTASEGGHERYPNKVRFSPDGAYFATIGSDNKVLVFDVKACVVVDDAGKNTRKMNPTMELKAEDGHTGAIYAFDWSDDSKEILTCGADKTAKIWSVEEGKVVTTFTIAESPSVDDMQMGAVWSGDNLFSISLSGAINVLDRENSSGPKSVIQGHKSQVQGIAVRKDGSFYTSCSDSRISHWTSYSAKWLEGRPETKAINHLASTHDDATLVAAGFDNKVVFSNCEGKVESSVVLGKPASCLAAGKASDVVAVGVGETLEFYKKAGDAWSKGSTAALSGKAERVDFNNDDTLVAVAVGKGAKVFDTEGKEVWACTQMYNVGTVAWSRCGNFLAVTSKGSTFIYDKSQEWKQRNSTDWDFHQSTVKEVLWTDSTCVTVSTDDSMIVWTDMEKFKTKGNVKFTGMHKHGLQAARLLDDNTVISVGTDGTMKVWKL